MSFTIQDILYSDLRYNRSHPAIVLQPEANDVDIASTMLDRIGRSRAKRGFGSEADFRLQPPIVYPNQDGTYTVMDGNLRLAYLQLCRDTNLRQRSRIRPLPKLQRDDPAIPVAVFATKLDTYPHIMRIASPTNHTDWLHDHWAHYIITAVHDGYSVAQISANTGFTDYKRSEHR